MAKDSKKKHKKRKHRSSSSDSEEERKKHKKKKSKVKVKKSELFGYSNRDNPFGDANLSTQFVWHKKEGSSSLSKKERQRMHAEKLEEIKKLKQRKEEREEERMEMERLREEETRLRESEQYGDWEKREEEFYLKQRLTSAKLRITNNREKPIDLIAKNILLYDEWKNGLELGPDGKPIASFGSNVEINLQPPYEVFQKLSSKELDELKSDIKENIQRCKNEKKSELEFWNSMLLLNEDRIKKKKSRSKSSYIHNNIDSDIDKMLENKTLNQLKDMKIDVLNTLNSGKDNIDISYWEAVAYEVDVRMAKLYVKSVHEEMLKASLNKLEQQKLKVEASSSSSSTKVKQEHDIEKPKQAELSADEDTNMIYNTQRQKEEKLSATYELALLSEEENASDADKVPIIDAATDMAELRKQFQVILYAEKERLSNVIEASNLDDSEQAMQLLAETKKHSSDDKNELTMQAGEVQLPSAVQSWHNKYRPRKPRYYNRVNTGYDWNKYNKTHYDADNPPPRMILGYKFNIFYPDLIDKTQTPKFKLFAADSPDFCIIRFSAGPPYEDIAFQIKNAEWNTGRKRGFKCTFERGILHLYFLFKREFYRK